MTIPVVIIASRINELIPTPTSTITYSSKYMPSRDTTAPAQVLATRTVTLDATGEHTCKLGDGCAVAHSLLGGKKWE